MGRSIVSVRKENHENVDPDRKAPSHAKVKKGKNRALGSARPAYLRECQNEDQGKMPTNGCLDRIRDRGKSSMRGIGEKDTGTLSHSYGWEGMVSPKKKRLKIDGITSVGQKGRDAPRRKSNNCLIAIPRRGGGPQRSRAKKPEKSKTTRWEVRRKGGVEGSRTVGERTKRVVRSSRLQHGVGVSFHGGKRKCQGGGK